MGASFQRPVRLPQPAPMTPGVILRKSKNHTRCHITACGSISYRSRNLLDRSELMKAAYRIPAILAVVMVSFCSVLVAQKNSTVPQPQAGKLPPIGPATPNRGALVDKPVNLMPMAPSGFTVSVSAELQEPRM